MDITMGTNKRRAQNEFAAAAGEVPRIAVPGRSRQAGSRGEDTIAALAHELDEKDIAALAFELWQARGCPAGSPEEDWFQAVELLTSQK